MIKSMTGYGKCEKQTENLGLSLELRTLNSRYLDFSHRLPKALLPFEDDALKLIKNKCIRGKVILSAKIEFFGNEKDNFVLNEDKLKNYGHSFEEKNKFDDFDKAAEDLRLATRHLGIIVGKVDVEEILGSIFNDFCIGK